MANEPGVEMTIDAQPTKKLFIEILTKDIPLTRAILDLVDNCVDGARRLRPDGNFLGLSVRIEATSDVFKIHDSCGGIPIDLARRHAFRFGRPSEMAPTPHSVGQFGVGMKRALFKLGTAFAIDSRTETEHFAMTVDVEKWSARPEWSFEFSEAESDTEPTPEFGRGTSITVQPLHENVGRDFALETFRTKLHQEIAAAHQTTLEQGIGISLNGVPLKFEPTEFLKTDELQPAVRFMEFGDGAKPVKVRICCGLGESSPSDAGWYVFCNARLILRADKSVVTGWGEDSDETIPRYHNQFARFRGLVFFDSDDASLLPWNTTKTGVDMDSPVYTATRQQMISTARPVFDFINSLQDPDGPSLNDVLDDAVAVKPASLNTERTFVAPKVDAHRIRTTTIQYSKPSAKIEVAKRRLGLTSARQVGSKTFDYYYSLECEE